MGDVVPTGMWEDSQKSRFLERTVLESPAKEGDSPVLKKNRDCLGVFPSSFWHVKSGANLGGPSPKAKYFLLTDSVLSSASER